MTNMKLIKSLFFICVFFILFFSYVFAQQNSTGSDPHVMHPVHPSLIIIIGILCTMFCLGFLILVCSKFCHLDMTHQAPHGLPHSWSRFSGIDKKLIESLPFFRFSSLKGSKEGLECVVCLSKFEDSEVLRLLPKCRHAFHMTCIDKWLENHSSCPLCRYKFDISDVTNFTCTNSLRYSQDEGLNNLEIFVKREHDSSSSSRFSIGSSFRKFGKSHKEDVLIQYGDQRLLDKFKHRIIVSDIVCKSRWSDVNSSDLMFLNSEMLNVVSSQHFSPSSSRRFGVDIEQVTKFKEDMEKSRLDESKVGTTTSSGEASVSSSHFRRFTETEDAKGLMLSRSSDGMEKRSMSEITNVSRFRETSRYWTSNEKDEKLQSIWLPMAKRTVRWVASQETNSYVSGT